MIWGIVILVAAVTFRLTWAKGREFTRQHGIHNIAGRAITLRPLHGQISTDATFWRASTTRATGKSRGRHHRAGWMNALISTGTLAVVSAVAYGLHIALVPTVAVLAFTVASGIVAGGIIGIRKARRWHANRTLIAPLAAASEQIIDPERSLGVRPEHMISMTDGWLTRKTGQLGEMKLPDRFHANPGQRDAVEHLVSSRLPVPVRFKWVTSKLPQRVVFLAAPPLPSMVRFRDHLEAIAENKPGEYVAGIDASGNLVRISLMIDNAHHAWSMNTGRGKSSLLQMSSAQLLAQDPRNRMTVIDTKQVSLEIFRGIPGVILASDPSRIDDMVTAIENVRDVMRQRYDELKADPTVTESFPLELLVLEEGNDFAVQLKNYWSNVKDRNDPATPPLWSNAIGPILWQGRAVNVHMIGVFQNMLERYLGGLSLRPSFGIVGLSGYRPNQWKTIIGTTPVPVSQRGKGRIIISDGESETWVQALYDDPEYLRAFAERNRLPQISAREEHNVSV